MKTKQILVDFLRDFLIVCGCFTVIVAILIGGSFIKSFNSSYIWQIMLISGAVVSFKYAFFNKYNYGNNLQIINFTVFSFLADIMIVMWIFLFSPNHITNKTLLLIYIIILFVVKLTVYAMMYSDSKKHAEQINKKLNEYSTKNN